MAGDLSIASGIAIVLLSVLLLSKWFDYKALDLNFIPTIGSANSLLSFFGGLKFAIKGHAMVAAGVKRYGPAMFRVPQMDKWVIVLSDPRHIADVRAAREHELSFEAAVHETMHTHYTLGEPIVADPYHVPILKDKLTKNIKNVFPSMHNELVTVFNDFVPPSSNGELVIPFAHRVCYRSHYLDWVTVDGPRTVMSIICRTLNRVFVGLPLCRDPDYSAVNMRFTLDAVIVALILTALPKFLHPLAGPLLSPVPRTLKRTNKHLGKLIQQRLEEDQELGADRHDRPNDLISWLLDAAEEDRRTVKDLSMRVITANFTAMFSSSNTFTHALYHLAASSEYQRVLRSEVTEIVEKEGWTKAAVEKMWKVDSFLRESLRFNGQGALVMERRVMKDTGFTFSDGTILPKGATLAVASYVTHHSEDNFADPYEFQPFRFSNLREKGEENKHQVTSATLDFVAFGNGRHACPGRFFAANNLKLMLAHIVYIFDVAIEGDAVPPLRWAGPHILLAESKVMFRRRWP